MNPEAFEMREQHRQLLIRNRMYLLHNLRPTESLWSMLMAKEIFSPDMIADIKSCEVTSEKIGRLLDLLPARGPNAFDNFCEALLECDHIHVADYLKTLEATDHFRRGIQPHCIDVSDLMLERIVNIFKKSTPTVQRFAERKFALNLAEQERDLKESETEVKRLTAENSRLQLEVTQLRSFMSSCTETIDSLSQEVQRDFLSKYFLQEEKKHLEEMKQTLMGIDGFDKVIEFYNNMQSILQFLEAFCGIKIREPGESPSENETLIPEDQEDAVDARPIRDKMQALVNMLVHLSDCVCGKTTMPSLVVRTELDEILKRVHEIVRDVFRIKDVFKTTLKQKRKLEGEVLSMIHSFQEMRRLEREVKEKQSHIAELNKQGQMMKKKTKHHRKHLEQIQLNVEQKRIQVREIQGVLHRHISSADQRLHSMLSLLPDLDEDDGDKRRNSDLTFGDSASEGSRIGTPGTVMTLNQKDPTGLNLDLETEVPSSQAPKSTKVRFAATGSSTANANETLVRIKPKDNAKLVTMPRPKPLLKQRSSSSRAPLTSRKASTTATSNSSVKLKNSNQANDQPKAATVKGDINGNTEASTAKRKSEPMDDIEKWLSQQQTSRKNQELQHKLALYQVTNDKTREKDEEKERTIRAALAKSDEKILSLEKKPEPQSALPSNFSSHSPTSIEVSTFDSGKSSLQAPPEPVPIARPSSSSNKDSHSSLSSHSRPSHTSHSSSSEDYKARKETEQDATNGNTSARRSWFFSRGGTAIDVGHKGTASVSVINADTISLSSPHCPTPALIRHTQSQILGSQQENAQHMKKPEHNRQPLPTKHIMIRLPSK